MTGLITNEVVTRAWRLAYTWAAAHGVEAYDDIEDLKGVAHLALVKAAQTYDPDAGAEFFTYAYRVILNELIHQSRGEGNTSLVNVPQKKQRDWQEALAARDVLVQAVGREVTYQEWAEYIHMDVTELFELRDSCTQDYYDIYVGTEEDGLMEENTMEEWVESPETGFEELDAEQTREAITLYVQGLTDNEKAVLTMLFSEDKSLRETADAMKMSHMRVARIRDGAFDKLVRRGIGEAV